jgi:hypothetical protein
MKLPRGFGKNYFSLNAITATVNAVTLQRESVRVQKFHTFGSFECDDAEEIEEFEELEAACLIQQVSQKACHCNCFFLSKTKKVLRSFCTPKQNLHFYAILNTDISPP